MTGFVQILGVLSARSIFNERLISCVRTREKWPFHHFLTLVIGKYSKEERNKLSDHFNCILVVRIDSTTCDRNMKENYFGVQNRVERFKGDGLLIIDSLRIEINLSAMYVSVRRMKRIMLLLLDGILGNYMLLASTFLIFFLLGTCPDNFSGKAQ